MLRFGSLICAAALIGLSGSSVFAQIGPRDRDFRDRDLRNRGPTTYSFGAKAHVARLAHELFEQSNSICWEMQRNYKGTRGFRESYREMYQFSEGAKRIEALAKANYWRHPDKDDKIVRELHENDRLFHHIEGDVRRWRSDTGRGDLRERMDQCEDTLHHIMEDYGVKTRIHLAEQRRGERP